jgi:glucose-6-phosphate dehydrogenase assembly protein OpcA
MRTEQGDVSPNPTRALLLAGWLKARLGWTMVSKEYLDTASGTYHWIMERTANLRTTRSLTPIRSKTGKLGNTASISIRPRVQTEMRPGSICLVRLVSKMENKQATFTISREEDLNTVLTSVELSHETRPKRTVSLAAENNEGELLRDELEILGHDYLFEQTLLEVAEMLSEDS